MQETATAVILAGGRGKRMDLLCHLRPKPALPFAGKLRVIDFTLSNCIHSQIISTAILVDYQRNYMANYLKKWAVANWKSTNIAILPPTTGSYAGTADAVYRNLGHLDNQSSSNVLILAGDHVYRMDYRSMLDFHEDMKADVTVGVIKVPIEEAYRFGTVIVDSEGKILEFVEKSSKPLSTLASMGIYIFNKEILTERLCEDARTKDSPHDFGFAILPKMVEHERVFAYEFNGYWQDIGTVEAYYKANMELLLSSPRFSLDGSWPILSDYNSLPIPQKSADGNIVNSVISPGCVIKGYVENSILSPGVHVEDKAIIKNSVVMANTIIGYHSVVDNCIIDEGVQVSELCYLGFGKSLLSDDSEITVVGKDVMIPRHTAVGRKCKVLPRVDLCNFAGSLVPSGTTVSSGAKKLLKVK